MWPYPTGYPDAMYGGAAPAPPAPIFPVMDPMFVDPMFAPVDPLFAAPPPYTPYGNNVFNSMPPFASFPPPSTAPVISPAPPPPPPPPSFAPSFASPPSSVTPNELQLLFESKKSQWAAEIIDNLLFLGSGRAAQLREELQRRRIRHILNVADDVPNYHGNDFVYLNLHVRDFGQDQKGISTRFQVAFDFLAERERLKEPLLVHCAAGINRSATIVIAWLMKRNALKLETAWMLVKQKRNICPLRDNRLELLKFERELHGCNFLTEEQLLKL